MRFNCASCGQRYKADESFAGEEMECSKCDSLIYIPDIEPVSAVAVPPPIKITIPSIKKTSLESEVMGKVEVPKLTMPASLGKKIQANKTEKVPSLSMPASLQANKTKVPSLSMAASAGEKLGANNAKVPSFNMAASSSEKLGDNNAKVPSLGMVASSGEKLRG